MIIESIQRVYQQNPLYTEARIYRDLLDEQSHKRYTEVWLYRVYNHRGDVLEHVNPTVDVRA